MDKYVPEAFEGQWLIDKKKNLWIIPNSWSFDIIGSEDIYLSEEKIQKLKENSGIPIPVTRWLSQCKNSNYIHVLNVLNEVDTLKMPQSIIETLELTVILDEQKSWSDKKGYYIKRKRAEKNE